jgi:hypothetical protein
MDILEELTLDSEKGLEHENFKLERSQSPCSHQKVLELSSTIAYALYKSTTSSYILIMLTLKGRL